jgi:hypothetical protein
VLRPGEAASFALETQTAYDVQYVITAFLITIPGDPMRILTQSNLSAAGRAGLPIPIGVTAFVAGDAGPPSR